MGEYPNRTWGIILQQAWSLRLKEKHKISYDAHRIANLEKLKGGTREICRRFNRGKGNYGIRCKYEHRCSYCFKMGHGIHNCRKAGADKQGKTLGDKTLENFSDWTPNTPELKSPGPTMDRRPQGKKN